MAVFDHFKSTNIFLISGGYKLPIIFIDSAIKYSNWIIVSIFLVFTNLCSTEPVTGVPSFWLTVLKSCPVVQDMLQDHDEPILQHLIDIKCNISKPGEEMVITQLFRHLN